jgi:predicted alpha/beta superfamily hydrolase
MLLSCNDGGSGSDGSNGRVSQFNGTIEPTISIRANFNGLTYPIRVYLPQAYEDLQQHFPVLYILDAEWNFDLVMNIVVEKGKAVIVVGIGNGDQQVAGRRATDYRMPGAREYYDFLTTQVIPYIDAQYRTDPSDRTLSGHSYSGLFTGLALLLEPPDNRYFANYFSQDGSFWDQRRVTEDLEEQMFATIDRLPVRLILAGVDMADGNNAFVEWFREILASRHYADFDLVYRRYGGDHLGVIGPSMRDALDLLYP